MLVCSKHMNQHWGYLHVRSCMMSDLHRITLPKPETLLWRGLCFVKCCWWPGALGTVKPRPEAHMDMVLLKCFWRASTWLHNNRYYNGTINIIDNVFVLSDLVESSGYSSKTLQKGSCPYAPLDEVLQYVMYCIVVYSVPGDVHRWYICVLLLQYRKHWERVFHICVFIFKLRCVSSHWGSFYASAPKVPEALCFRVVRPSVRPDLCPDFFVYAITQVLLDGISSNLVQGSTTRSRWTD